MLALVGLLALAGAAAAQTAAVGLSTVRSQRFGNENLSGFFTPQATDLFAHSLAAGDFNGDGADDLATGIPLDNGPTASPVTDSGSVVVRYSTPGGGLTTNLSSVYLRQSATRDAPETGDRYGSALASCDFDGDDFDDLAVGIPYEDHGGHSDTGAVQIHYGTGSGLPAAGDQFFTQSSPGVPGDVEGVEHFGTSLACGDFDGDGFDDLAVGVPLENFDNTIVPCCSGLHVAQGVVAVIPGSALGLDPSGSKGFDQNVEGMSGEAEDGDVFGSALAAADFNRDGFADLAIGVPGEDDGDGYVHVVFGGPAGLTTAGNLLWGEGNVGATSESDDRFGAALATGDFDGDGFADLAVGVPFENIGAAANTGQVDVLYGDFDGFNPNRTQFFAEAAIFGAGTSEADDSFGYAVVAGDFDKDGFDDLAIAHPAESVGGAQDGAVTVVMGSAAGLSSARRRQVAAGVEGFPGDPNQHAEYLGFALTSGDFDGDGHADLVAGAPYENEPGIPDAGAETVLYGALFADGVESGGTTLWSQTVSSSLTTFNNLRVSTAAKLGPASSKLGVQVNLFSPTLQKPAASTYVRVGGPEMGFHDETTLSGTFFVDPQGLTMSPNAGKNVFQLVAFKDGLGTGSRTRLAFELNRNDSVGGWALLATYFDDNIGATRFAGGAGFALANPADPSTHNNRIDFEWRAGGIGHLTVWRTRYVGGVPQPNSKEQLFSVDLPGMQFATVNHVLAGMVSGQDSGTFGALYLDELSFRR